MKKQTILGILLVLVICAFNCACNRNNVQQRNQQKMLNFFQRISAGYKLKKGYLKKDTLNVWHFNIEIFDSVNLIPRFAESKGSDKEVTHQFWCTFKKDTEDSWKMTFESYELHYYDVTTTSDGKNVGIGSYCLHIDNESAWLCDWWKMEYFPWLKDSKKVKLGDNQFKSVDEAMKNLPPPHVFQVYENIKNLVPKVLH